jgi:hypothetical protein
MFSLHTSFDIVWAGILGLIAIVYPSIAVFVGRRFLRTMLIAWGLMIAYVAFLSLGLPIAVALFAPHAARELELHWVPEGPFVFAIAVLGWLYPVVGGLFGLAARWIMRRARASSAPNI